MDNWEHYVKKLVELMGFKDFRIEVDAEHHHGSIYIYDNPAFVKENVATIVDSLNHLLQLVAKKYDQPPIYFDLNNYRHERENLIVELARVAAKKALATKKSISLPAMNSYERRLVHVALAIHPDVTTESLGKGKERYVVIKPIDGEAPSEERENPGPQGSVSA